MAKSKSSKLKKANRELKELRAKLVLADSTKQKEVIQRKILATHERMVRLKEQVKEERQNLPKKTKKSPQRTLEDQLAALHKKLIFASSQTESNQIRLKIINLKKKMAIAKVNKTSKLNSVTARFIQGGSPGLKR